jgi:hypothetical protein
MQRHDRLQYPRVLATWSFRVGPAFPVEALQMMHQVRSAAFVAAALAASGLAGSAAAQTDPVVLVHAEPPIVARGAVASLPLGGTVRVEGTDLHVTFERVAQDSRCPRNVTCVWAGEATVELRLRDADGSERPIVLVIPGGQAAVQVPGGTLIETVGLSGPPEFVAPGDGLRLPAYVLRLRLRPEEAR